MLDAAHVWRDRRLILFTEWDDTRRWLVERLKEGLLQRSRGRVDLERPDPRFHRVRRAWRSATESRSPSTRPSTRSRCASSSAQMPRAKA